MFGNAGTPTTEGSRIRPKNYVFKDAIIVAQYSLDRALAMKPYQEKFPIGTAVRIAELPELERFRTQWRFHHPLEPGQLAFAGRSATVATVGFYHGGDVLYTLEGVSGIWHEQCVHALDHSTRTT